MKAEFRGILCCLLGVVFMVLGLVGCQREESHSPGDTTQETTAVTTPETTKPELTALPEITTRESTVIEVTQYQDQGQGEELPQTGGLPLGV